MHLRGDCMRGEAEHQRRREGPWLGRVIFDAVDFDAGFLEHLARYGVFERFSRFDEAGDGGVAPDRPAGLASQEGALRVTDQHDDGRIDARELLMAAAWVAAHEHMSAFGGQGLRAAGAAEAVPPPPGDDGARIT